MKRKMFTSVSMIIALCMIMMGCKKEAPPPDPQKQFTVNLPQSAPSTIDDCISQIHLAAPAQGSYAFVRIPAGATFSYVTEGDSAYVGKLESDFYALEKDGKIILNDGANATSPLPPEAERTEFKAYWKEKWPVDEALAMKKKYIVDCFYYNADNENTGGWTRLQYSYAELQTEKEMNPKALIRIIGPTMLYELDDDFLLFNSKGEEWGK